MKENLVWKAAARCVVLASILCVPVSLLAERMPVRYSEGVLHGFLVLRSQDGQAVASGELIQSARGSVVTSRLLFHFADGSLHDDTVVFSQRGTFRFISDHLIQRGPSFPTPIDVQVNAAGECTVNYQEKGEMKTATAKLKDRPDAAMGMIPVILKNMGTETTQFTVSVVVATPKPRLVKLVITPRGEGSFTVAGIKKTATDYGAKVDIGGVAGAVAPIVGKQPADTHIWVMSGEAPALISMQGAFYDGGPVWTVEMASPVGPKSAEVFKSEKTMQK